METDQLGRIRWGSAVINDHKMELLKALREESPGKLLGRLLPKKQESTVRLIEALSGTPSDETEWSRGC